MTGSRAIVVLILSAVAPVAVGPHPLGTAEFNPVSAAVKVMDPNAESYIAITPVAFDRATAGQEPLVVTDEPRVARLREIVKRLSCRATDTPTDVRYKWIFTRRDGQTVVLYASRDGDVWAANQYWRCIDSRGWLDAAWAAAGGQTDRAPSYFPPDPSRLPRPSGRTGVLLPWTAPVAAATLMFGLTAYVLAAVWRRR